MAIELAEQLEGRHPAFVHRSAGCVDILCHASGESEVPGVALAKNRDQVRAFILGQWCGGEGSELDEAMADFDAHDWDDEPYLGWEFEIGGVKLEQVYEALVEPAAAPEAGMVVDDYARIGLLEWAVERWRSSVQNRPLVNIHRRTMDDCWRSVMRYAGGNPDDLVGPRHASAQAPAPQAGAPLARDFPPMGGLTECDMGDSYE